MRWRSAFYFPSDWCAGKVDIEPEWRQLEDGDFLIMVTDGVLDTLPTGKQDSLMEEFICQVESQNPGEMAHHILNRVMEYAAQRLLMI